MKIDFQDRTWEFDEADITNRQAEKVRAHTGLSVSKWLKALRDTEADRWESLWDAMYWLMLQQNDQAGGSIADVDYPVYKFIAAYMEAFKAENADAEEAEPDPTRPAADSAPSPEPAARKASARAAGTAVPDG